MTKITRATVKKFIRENKEDLQLNIRNTFDGMIDGTRIINGGFQKADLLDNPSDNDLGIRGFWLVGSSRDLFLAYETDTHKGIEYSNCCGHGIIAITK